MASKACIVPTSPGTAPITPAIAQVGLNSEGGGSGEKQRKHGPGALKMATVPAIWFTLP